MSNLLQDIVKKVRFTTYQVFYDTVNKNLKNLNRDEKIKLEQDQINIIEAFKKQAILEIACLQKRLININRELFEIQQKEFDVQENLQNKYYQEEITDQNEEKAFEIKSVDNNCEKASEKDDENNNNQIINVPNVTKTISLSNSQDFTPSKLDKSNNDALSMTYSNNRYKKNTKSQRKNTNQKKNSVPKKNSDSSSSSISLSRREIKHMEKNSDIYHQTISKYETIGSHISHEVSQKSNLIRRRKRIEKVIYQFREEVKNIGNSYPKKKKF